MNDYIHDLNIGDIVSFRSKSKLFKIRGEFKSYFYYKDNLFLKIYSFYHRTEKTYRVNNNNELIEATCEDNDDYGNEITNDPIIYPDLKYDNKINNRYSNLFKKIIYSFILIVFIFSITPNISLPKIFDNYSYTDFLNEKLSLNSLFQIVKSRVRYVYDVGDQWNTPLYAWNEKGGDCEEFAGICSDYLTRHNIENYLVGLNLLKNGAGHAAVFVKMQESFYIIDPTYAAESAGLKKLKVKSLKEAVKLYSILPAEIYKIPSFNGEKEVVSQIY